MTIGECLTDGGHGLLYVAFISLVVANRNSHASHIAPAGSGEKRNTELLDTFDYPISELSMIACLSPGTGGGKPDQALVQGQVLACDRPNRFCAFERSNSLSQFARVLATPFD